VEAKVFFKLNRDVKVHCIKTEVPSVLHLYFKDVLVEGQAVVWPSGKFTKA
jgi:hypothetical protein